MIAKHDEREFPCEKCEITVRGRLQLKAHKRKHKEITCKKCRESVPYNSATSHKTKCLGENFKCENCGKVYKRKYNLKIHMENENCSISCDRCGKDFKTAGHMEKHIRSTHQIQVNVVETSEGHMGLFQTSQAPVDLNCPLCGFAATKPSKLKRHMMTHKKPEKEEEKCPKCDLTFKYKSDLNRHIQTPHRTAPKGNSRANQYRKLKKMDVAKAHDFQTCTESDLIAMIEKTDVSTNQLLKLLSVLRKRFGRRAFEPNLKEKIRAHLNSLDNEFETKSKTFQTKDGKPLQSSLSKTKNVKEFIDHIVELRGIEKPKLILGLDGDVRHLMITAVLKETDDFDDEDDVNDELMSTSSKRVLVLAKVDGVPETRHNIELMLNEMNLQDLGDNFQVVCDLKMMNILLGIQSSTSLFGCPFCEASKINEDGKVTNQRGEWNYDPVKTRLRTINNIVEHANAYQNEPLKKNGKQDKTKTKQHKCVKFVPIKLKNGHDDSWVGKYLPPDPLHCNVLGPPNDCFDLMEEVFGKEELTAFYKRHHEKRSGEAAGGKFDGKAVKNLWTEKALLDLSRNFPPEIEPFVRFLRNVREVHEICMKDQLDTSAEYREKIDEFEQNRKYLSEVFGLNQTLKMKKNVGKF